MTKTEHHLNQLLSLLKDACEYLDAKERVIYANQLNQKQIDKLVDAYNDFCNGESEYQDIQDKFN